MAGIQIDGVNNKIDFDDDADTSISSASDDTLVVEVGGNTLATVTSTGVTINDGTTIITNDNSDTLTLQSADDDASEGPVMVFDRASSSPADDDVLGAINFRGKDSGGNGVDYVKIQAEIMQESDGSEDGQLQFNVQKSGTSRNILTLDRTAVIINEDSQDIDFRVESNANTHQFMVDGGNNSVLINKSAPSTNYNHSTSLVPGFEIFGTSNTNNRISAFTYGSEDAGAHIMMFGKQRDATPDSYTVAQADDQMGNILFQGADGTHFISGAAIRAYVTSGVGANDMPGQLRFYTNSGTTDVTERFRIESHGQALFGDTLSAEDSQKLHSSRNDQGPAFGAEVRHGGLGSSNSVAEVSCLTSSSAAYRLFRGVSGNGTSTTFSDNEFIFTGAGGLSIDGASVTTGGADYAEMFEWKDGNSSSEDRRGYSVVLDGNKVVKATDSDDASKIIGVVSALPVVIGDSDIDDKWKSKYLKDDFGNYILEEYTVTEWTETIETKNDDGEVIESKKVLKSFATDRIPSDVTVPSDAVVKSTHDDGTKITRKTLNPDWDSSQTYVRRQDRKEWDAIGLMGKLRMLKGQPTGTNWIKMRDISETIEEWLVR